MGWIAVALLALAAAGLLWRFADLPRGAIELIGAALFVGIAGYAWQGRPTLPGSPTEPRAASRQPDDATLEQAGRLASSSVGGTADILAAAENLHRQGLHAYAIATIRLGLKRAPRNADLWVGLGSALILYAEGRTSPAAKLAFDRAAAIAPWHPGPPFFAGLAFAQAGQFDQAEEAWQALLDRAPARSDWRGDVEAQLAQLRAARVMMAR